MLLGEPWTSETPRAWAPPSPNVTCQRWMHRLGARSECRIPLNQHHGMKIGVATGTQGKRTASARNTCTRNWRGGGWGGTVPVAIPHTNRNGDEEAYGGGGGAPSHMRAVGP